MVAGKGEAVGRHPMVGEGQGRGDISRTPSRRAVEPGLERVALAAPQALRQAPIGAAAGERDAHHAVAREMIVEPGRAAALATLHWFTAKPQALGPLGAFGTPSGISPPSAAVRLRITSVAV